MRSISNPQTFSSVFTHGKTGAGDAHKPIKVSAWLFLAVRRVDTLAKPHRYKVTAMTYEDAKRLIARDFVAVFAGHLPA